MKLSLSEVAEFTDARGEFNPESLALGYSIDSRSIRAGELFFAVKGERLDGHDFVEQALQNGAVAAVVRKDQLSRYSDKCRLLAVDDTLTALQALASSVRGLWGKTLVGVTGSTGKTTTKEAIAHVLSARFRILKSEGNFNNHFGLPLMLLKVEPEHDMAVIEMGMSHAGEIAALAKIAQPDIGVVTNVGPVHLEFFDSIAGIARAKRELIDSLPPAGVAILNADDEYVSHFGEAFDGKVITYGVSSSATVRAVDLREQGTEGSTFEVVMGGGEHISATVPLIGIHNAYNALAAIAVAREQGMSLQQSAAALATLVPADKRGEVVQVGNICVINDCYNSNPKALSAMVDALASMPASRRIVVAGEMLELGPSGEAMHRECGEHIAKKRIDVLLGVRGLANAMVDAARKRGIAAGFVESPEQAGEWLAREARDGDVILLKASRGVRLEKALEAFRRERELAAHS